MNISKQTTLKTQIKKFEQASAISFGNTTAHELESENLFVDEIDPIEERINDFLERNGVICQHPINKYYDFLDKQREAKSSCSNISSNSLTPCSLSPKEECMKKNQNFTLSSSLYLKRKNVGNDIQVSIIKPQS